MKKLLTIDELKKTNEAKDATSFSSLDDLKDYVEKQLPKEKVGWDSMAKTGVVIGGNTGSVSLNIKDGVLNLSGFNGYDLEDLAKKYDMQEYHRSLGQTYYQSPSSRKYTTEISLEDLKYIIGKVNDGIGRESTRQADFYKDRQPD